MDRTTNLVNILFRMFPALLPGEVKVHHDATSKINTTIRAIHEDICITCYLLDSEATAITIKYDPSRTEYVELTFFSVPETEEGIANVVKSASDLLNGITDELKSMTGSRK